MFTDGVAYINVYIYGFMITNKYICMYYYY